jgi:hypothetical protein
MESAEFIRGFRPMVDSRSPTGIAPDGGHSAAQRMAPARPVILDRRADVRRNERQQGKRQIGAPAQKPPIALTNL